MRPNEEQRAKLKALQSAATQAAERPAAACPSELPTTRPAGRRLKASRCAAPGYEERARRA
ncbi:MAG TPA: hypothetical protein VKC66_10200 [Xanthobacteraceae bacterium]|nr:hypothetical protein [Xanthobacteraceae bacterium]